MNSYEKIYNILTETKSAGRYRGSSTRRRGAGAMGTTPTRSATTQTPQQGRLQRVLLARLAKRGAGGRVAPLEQDLTPAEQAVIKRLRAEREAREGSEETT